ncbi:hypothetical protein LEP1GSC128_2003 [Leptospira borgpetersenii str. 200801926]|uniref:Uncharacterized protein n=3 Tax=Leptospira borgpetersenii TaxID=174 RepID=M3GJA2_LEPBO|nr:hypothetical protein LEP1GSC128_2003 [Leptospira borgpetersenii str. 200801926]EMG01037.1 hypothetical protein LEP1GSC123_3655 [Leptospira borgpetersenii str. 200701203]EMK09412.1 hypothetical protein LEP1GSC066_1412 [Leptospira sp. serovar Kenya str. Sh9]
MKYFRFIMAPPARKRLGQSPKFFYKKTLSFRSRKIPTDKTQQKGAGPRFFATTRRCDRWRVCIFREPKITDEKVSRSFHILRFCNELSIVSKKIRSICDSSIGNCLTTHEKNTVIRNSICFTFFRSFKNDSPRNYIFPKFSKEDSKILGEKDLNDIVDFQLKKKINDSFCPFERIKDLNIRFL